MNREELLFKSGWEKCPVTGNYQRHEPAQEIEHSKTCWMLITHGKRGGKTVKRFKNLATIISQPGILSPECEKLLTQTVRATW